MSFALFLAKNVHLSIGEEFCTFPCQKFAPLSPLLNGAEFPFSVAKNVALFKAVRIVRRKVLLLSNGVTGDWITKKNDGTVLLLIEKMNQINTKNYWNRKKRLCVRLRSGDRSTPPEKICRSKSTNQEGLRCGQRTDLCFSICRFSQVVSIPRAQPHAQSLFLFPIVFGINFFFAWKLLEKMKNDTTFVRMRSGDHVGDAKMSKKCTSLRRI